MKVRKDDEHFGRLYTGLINIFHFPIYVLLQLTRQEDKLTGYSRREQAKQTHKSKQEEKGKINGKKLEEEERVRETQQQAHKTAFEVTSTHIMKSESESNLKEISPEYSLEGLMLKLKLRYSGHLIEELTHCKRLCCWERLKAGGEGDDRG